MNKWLCSILWVCLINWTISSVPLRAAGPCVGRMVNPMTDVCWKCLFPIKIMHMTVASGGPDPDSHLPRSPICWCHTGTSIKRPGIPVSFWEPVRLVDVTRTPYCLVNMGGKSVADTGIKSRGDVEYDTDIELMHSFYHVHWYVYPVIYWLELIVNNLCFEKGEVDLAYLSELDPFWNDDEKSAIINPEGILFGNPIAQAACAADCVAATVHLPFDPLFWCDGCHGGMYPFTGTIGAHTSGVQASSLAATKMMAKLHREGLLSGYIGVAGFCDKYPMPIIKKSQYRLQMTYPIPVTKDGCKTLGHTDITWNPGKEFPYTGSDFGYLVWRKRDCCFL